MVRAALLLVRLSLTSDPPMMNIIIIKGVWLGMMASHHLHCPDGASSYLYLLHTAGGEVYPTLQFCHQLVGVVEYPEMLEALRNPVGLRREGEREKERERERGKSRENIRRVNGREGERRRRNICTCALHFSLYPPIVSKHCERVNITELPIALPAEAIPQVCGEDLRSLQEHHRLPSVLGHVPVAGELRCQQSGESHGTLVAAAHQQAHLALVMLQWGMVTVLGEDTE